MQELTDAGLQVGPTAAVDGPAELLDQLAAGHRLLWDATSLTYPALVGAGIRVERCHDITLTERILLGRQGVFGAPCSARAVHARATGTPVPDDPVRTEAYAEPTLFEPGATGDNRVEALAVDPIEVLRVALVDQLRRIADDRALGLLIAAESASALAAVEMGSTGLPWRAEVHLGLLASMLGPRPRAGERPTRLAQLAAEINDAFGFPVNPDSAVDLRAAFRRVGFDIDTTRSWVIKDLAHPAVASVLTYKELARIHTANGWNWHDEWARDGRFRPEYLPGGVVSGRWATRGGGALQIPRALRAAVVADADLYTALADDGFGGDRAHAKLAMLGAMYGQTSGEAGRLLDTLRRRYPAAMQCVQDAAHRGERGEVVRSVLGRACPPPSDGWREVVEWGSRQDATDPERKRADLFARVRGRFTRNFVVQASAADWAAVWLSGLRRDLTQVPGAELVFFQHDELIVQVPVESASLVADLSIRAARAARDLVFPGSVVSTPVRPVIVDCYADAK